ETVETAIAEAQDRAAGGLNEHARGLMSQLQEDLGRHTATARESTVGAAAESGQRMAALRDAMHEQSQRLEAILAGASESNARFELHAAQLETAKQQALAAFEEQLADVLNLHRKELHRRSGSLIEEINERIRAAFEESTRQAAATFNRQVEEMVQPHIS